MVRSPLIALAVSISLGTVCLATDAFARGGGFGGAATSVVVSVAGLAVAISAAACATSAAAATSVAACATCVPRCASRAWTIAPEIRPADDHRAMDEHRDDDHRADDAARRDDDHRATTITAPPTTRHDRRRPSGCARRRRRRAADDHNLDHHDDLAHNWNNWHQPVNVGRWDHNGFWNNNWNARNFNCYNCRWGWVGPGVLAVRLGRHVLVRLVALRGDLAVLELQRRLHHGRAVLAERRLRLAVGRLRRHGVDADRQQLHLRAPVASGHLQLRSG